MLTYLISAQIFWLTTGQDINQFCNPTKQYITVNGCYHFINSNIYIAPEPEKNGYYRDWVLYHELGHHLFGLNKYPGTLFPHDVKGAEKIADTFAWWILHHGVKSGENIDEENYNKLVSKEADAFFTMTCDKECVNYIINLPIPGEVINKPAPKKLAMKTKKRYNK